MTESRLETARRAAGLSRTDFAKQLGTTVHHYWQCERNPDGADQTLMIRAHEALGIPLDAVSSGEVAPTPQDSPTPAGSGPTMRLWRCPRCHHEEEQPGVGVSHRCPKNGYKLTELRLVLKPREEQ